MEKVPYLGHTLLRWQCGPSSFLALPEKGARLMNWNIQLADGTVRDVIFWPELKELGDISKVRGGNPILFPFCGRSFDEEKIHFWKDAEGRSRPMPLHGFARQGEFRLTRLDARGFAAQLVPNDEARTAYPYDYEFEVTYRFEPFGLTCEFTLRNLGKTPIPWSAGHHFYFTVPWSEGSTRAEYLLRIPSSRTSKQDMEKTGALLPGPALQLNESLANPALVDTFHSGLKSNTLVFGQKGCPGDVHLRIGNGKVPHPDATVVTWTSDESAPFYCIEPWMGPANAAAHKQGLHWVQPGQTQSFLVEVLVK